MTGVPMQPRPFEDVRGGRPSKWNAAHLNVRVVRDAQAPGGVSGKTRTVSRDAVFRRHIHVSVGVSGRADDDELAPLRLKGYGSDLPGHL
jgi:hypothetical protein